ncbi:17199_t:CDS:2 [Cetraspora pellucida]|uniref:EKC/KEOPS complex subunit CGI121 n=1 Tax=Cetraspora pellucida TaxID=1433469 RepID=A0A9N9BYZ9_9GLOM|nr:17199_t:CDS:2 [Cetraspora pellucida]
MQSYSLELYPSSGQIHIALYTNVLDKFQLLVAVNNAVHSENYSKLKTHNVHSEIVYNLSPTTNISESLRRFGISDSTNEIIVVKVGGNDDDEIKSHLNTLIDGEESSLDDFSKFTDLSCIKKQSKM